MTEYENIEWQFVVTVADVPEPTAEQLEEMMPHIKGIISWDAETQRLRFVFRRTVPHGVRDVLVDGQLTVGMALVAVLGDGMWQLRHYVREFAVRRAEDVPVDPEVQRWVDAMTEQT
jgi:hypothetical protein